MTCFFFHPIIFQPWLLRPLQNLKRLNEKPSVRRNWVHGVLQMSNIKLIMLETDIKQIPFIKNHIDFINQHQRVTQKDNY